MRANSIVWLICISMLLALIASPNCPGQAADARDPKAVALEFAKALEAGDGDTVVRLAVDGEKNEKDIRAVVRVNVAMQKVRKAAAERFGPAGAAVAGSDDPKDSLAAKVAASAAKMENDRAQVPIEGANTVVLRRIDGSWRVDMGRMLSVAKQAATLAEIQEQLAENISAGKYKSPEQALDALGGMLVEAARKPPPRTDPLDDENAARATVVSFVRDLFNGNTKAAAERCLTAAPDDPDLKTLAAMYASYRRMGEEAVTRFGAKGKVVQPTESSILEVVTRANVMVDGNTAFIWPIGMKRSGKEWKIDLANTRRQPLWQAEVRSAKLVQAVCEDVTHDIKIGKFKSAEETNGALAKRIAATADPQQPEKH